MNNYKKEPIQLNLVNIEKEMLKFWKDNDIFSKVNQKNKGKAEWVYYDGPITANGLPHYGHAITWTMKDVVPRYHTMNGRFVSRNLGWDCQGILVEYEVEKRLDFKHKSEIEKMGIDKFNSACRESVLRFREKMIEYETRLGRWIDHEDEYSTMESSYIESIWWAIKQLYEKGLLYQGHKVVAYSTRAGMTLSSHEVADGGYKEVIDPGVTIKFKLREGENTFALAWTTTPWTLPGNLLLAVGNKITYVKVKQGKNYYVLAKNVLEKVFKDRDYVVVGEQKGSDIVGTEYEPLFNYYSSKRKEGAFRIVHADHVNTEEGTGVVHLAPYGQEDFNIFLSLGIKLFDYIDETGNFTNEIPEYSGMFYKDANEKIISKLRSEKKLFKLENYAHKMPVSYRTKEPLIYKPIESWYVAVNKIKPDMLKALEDVKWVSSKSGIRFKMWIENARDWSLSRRRYWGTPLPIWMNDKSSEYIVVGSFKELEKLYGAKVGKSFDPHKPYIDKITWKSSDGGVFRRLPEVIDVWFDSGSMPYAQYNYPFSNKSLFSKRFPADYISESDDQIRLWFYTMFVLGVALFGKSPFRNVVVTGMLGDEKGKKLSKSSKNYPPIEEVFDEYGSEMLRYFLLTSPITRGEFTSFSYKYLLEVKKEFFTTLWNSYRYFLTYASLHEFSPDLNFQPVHVLDKWMTTRINETVSKIRKYMDEFEVMYAVRELSPLVNDLSTWYIRRSRNRISRGDVNALNVLHRSLSTISKLMAPFMPLLSEYIYKNVDSELESVHLCDYPVYDAEMLKNSQKLRTDMVVVREICALGNSVRKLQNIPVRQPLSEMQVMYSHKLDNELVQLIRDELNVKKITFVEKVSKSKDWVLSEDGKIRVGLYKVLTEDLLVEGYARELMREIQKLRKQKDVDWNKEVKVQYKSLEKYKKAVAKFEKEIKEKTLSSELVSGQVFDIL